MSDSAKISATTASAVGTTFATISVRSMLVLPPWAGGETTGSARTAADTMRSTASPGRHRRTLTDSALVTVR
ncbi:hypothetical protein Xph01_13100 [Micromonospora phaseoli]|nr:hypothetical protein Xph01_13100 [Micromonospora phaseoli]